ncbi:MAG TPA: hypothetical protein VKU90_08050 [Caulobacteraceae bacterium]|nr:hypothetical protein [Caulobacteraceae bacterium]
MTWRAVAERLRAAGRVVATPAASAGDVGAPYFPNLAALITRQLPPASNGWILVGHSAAGGLLPAIAEALDGQARGALFVDAILPHPGQCWFESAPPALARAVAVAVGDGRAPPWPDWFAPATFERLLPDEVQRSAFAAEIRGVPAAYLAEAAPVAPHWPPAGCAYLQLSEGYGAEAAAAARRWPVGRLALDHLAMLTQPAKVAAAVERAAVDIEAA